MKRPALIPKRDIRYLSLEGGGGKGFAYLGALEALERLEILRYRNGRLGDGREVRGLSGIRGVAGASAGAITALFLSCGYTPAELERELSSNDYSQFFGPIELGRVPGLIGLIDRHWEPPTITETEVLTALVVDLMFSKKGSLRRRLESWGIAPADLSRPPFRPVQENPQRALATALFDLGFYGGDEFLQYFGRVIERAKNPKRKNTRPTLDFEPDLAMTFLDHWKTFEAGLGVMGTNLETGKSVLFSVVTTPSFPVAAAVRISMGIPLVFKPMVFTPLQHLDVEAEDLTGVWIDGGLLNNVPLRVIDETFGGLKPRRPTRPRKPKFRTLALRLDEEERDTIRDLVGLLTKWATLGFRGAGEAHIERTLSTLHRTILLNTEGLSLLDFSPPRGNQAAKIRKRSFDTVLEAFGEKVTDP